MHWIVLAQLWLWVIVLATAGRALSRLLPARVRPFAAGHLSLGLGLAGYVVLATAVGWLAGTRTAIALPVTLGITALLLWREGDWRKLRLHLGWQMCAITLISGGVLVTLYQFEAYNIYNDAFTYLVHGQWLQEHRFAGTQALDALHPAYTQVAIYQAGGYRMGGSFFLGWAQAVSLREWSYETYPAVITIFVAAGAQAIGGLVRSFVGPRGNFAPAWSVVAGTSIGGFTFGAVTGFLPQMAGLALATSLFALLPRFRFGAAQSSSALGGAAFVGSLLLGATVLAYHEISPFVIAPLGLWLLAQFALRPTARGEILRFGVLSLVWSAVLLGAEAVRLAPALTRQSHAVVGWPVPWSVLDIVRHAVGLHSGSGDGDVSLVPPSAALAILAVMAAGILMLAHRRLRRTDTLLALLAPLSFVALCTAGILYFRYGVPSPWAQGVGQTWNQFKLSNWVSPVLFALVAAGLSLLLPRRGGAMLQVAAAGLFIAGNLFAHHRLSHSRIVEMQRLTGLTSDMFRPYLQLRALAVAGENSGTTYLDLGGDAHKSRQTLAYFLHDVPVASDWSDDGYVYATLPKGDARNSFAAAKWWVHRISPGAPPPDLRCGTLAFAPIPDFSAEQNAISGGHGVEYDASGWWVWTPDQVSVRFRLHNPSQHRMRLSFTYVSATEARKLTVRRLGPNPSSIDSFTMDAGWQTHATPAFETTEASVEFEFTSPGTTTPIAATDPRQVAFLVKNVRLEPVPKGK